MRFLFMIERCFQGGRRGRGGFRGRGRGRSRGRGRGRGGQRRRASEGDHQEATAEDQLSGENVSRKTSGRGRGRGGTNLFISFFC